MKIRILALLALLLVTASSFAQGDGASSSLTGLVVDSSGGPAPGATAVARNKVTGATFEAVTNGQGVFTIKALPVGTYSVTVSLPGFKNAQIKDVKLAAGTPVEVRATLEIGGLQESVIVDSGWSANDTLTASRTDRKSTRLNSSHQ